MSKSFLQYNNINLEVMRVIQVLREPVRSFDSAETMFIRWRIEVAAILNPGWNSFDSSGASTPNFLAVDSDSYIYKKLMEPRRKLRFHMCDKVIYESPKDDAVCDPTLGPRPLYCTVTRITGSKTWFIHYGIESHELACSSTPSSLVVSHRFSSQEILDESYLSRRIITGTIVFDLSRMNPSISVDTLRPLIAHPSPPGFKRTRVSVTVHPSNTSIDYVIEDSEQFVSYGENPDEGIASLQGFYTAHIEVGNILHEHVVVRATGTRKPTAAAQQLAQKLLVQRVMAIAAGKLVMSPNVVPLIKRATITTGITSPFVELNMVTLSPKAVQPGPLGFGAISDRLESIGTNYNNALDVNQTSNPRMEISNVARTFHGNIVPLTTAILRDPCAPYTPQE